MFSEMLTYSYIYMRIYSSSSSPVFFYPVLSLNNGGGRIYLIILQMELTANLHLERLLASLSFTPTFLLCSITAFCQVFLVPFTLKCNLLRKLFLSFLKTCSYQRTLLSFAS